MAGAKNSTVGIKMIYCDFFWLWGGQNGGVGNILIIR